MATKKRVAFYISVQTDVGKQEIICEFSDRGDIYISIDFSTPADIHHIEELIRDSINESILEKIYDFLAQSGYTFVLFQNLSDPNIEINNITYTSSIAHNKKIDLSLDRTFNLLKKLGNPQDELEFIHVAGTCGKGSVCHYLEYLFVENGKKRLKIFLNFLLMR